MKIWRHHFKGGRCMNEVKTCYKCGQKKPLQDFYKHAQMADGYLNKCKDCTKKDVRQNRSKRNDYYREFDRKRNSLPHRVLNNKEYWESEKGKEVKRKIAKKYKSLNPKKIFAINKLNNAVRDKKINKPEICSICGIYNKIIHGHHEDYLKPLDVVWVCPKCHKNIHNRKLNDTYFLALSVANRRQRGVINNLNATRMDQTP
jgi:hypothetical protein